eukprot:3763451-Amphidinium_carterae.1
MQYSYGQKHAHIRQKRKLAAIRGVAQTHHELGACQDSSRLLRSILATTHSSPELKPNAEGRRTICSGAPGFICQNSEMLPRSWFKRGGARSRSLVGTFLLEPL